MDKWLERRRQLRKSLAARFSRSLAAGLTVEEPLRIRWRLIGDRVQTSHHYPETGWAAFSPSFVKEYATPDYCGDHLANRALGWGMATRVLPASRPAASCDTRPDGPFQSGGGFGGEPI
jgi:hypothetical protein